MPDWRDTILQHFREPIHRLTLVADPDGLLLEEELLAELRQNGFDLFSFDDHVAFRHRYESQYRQRWDDQEDTDLAVVLTLPRPSLRTLPYDLLQSGRALRFGLSHLFPKLSYPVICDLDHAHLQSLYNAYQQYAGPEMGDRASSLFVMKHVFGIVPDMIQTPADLLTLLLSRHSRGVRVPPPLDALLLDSLSGNPHFDGWPLGAMVSDAGSFFDFLQQRWMGYVAAQQPDEHQVKESGIGYQAGDPLPFDDPDVRVHMDNLFLEGKLKPVQLPEGWVLEGWAQVGVEVDELSFELQRFTGLLTHLERELPSHDVTHRDWMRFAVNWAELTVLRHRLGSELGDERVEQYRALHLRMEQRFAEWMLVRYHTLHSLPFLPAPIMVHHIPHFMAHFRDHHPDSRLALVVVDGLALDQWRVIRDVWTEESQDWSIQEGTLFAWMPTLTSISRQAIFAGAAPQFFPGSWQTTSQEASQWLRFWSKQGLHSAHVASLRNLGVKAVNPDGSISSDGEVALEPEVEEIVANSQIRVAGLVLNTVDNIMHGMQLGTAGMHQQVHLWIAGQRYLTRLVSRLLEESFTVFLTSDHGNVWARGEGRPNEGVLVEKRGQRARVYTDPAFAALGKEQSPAAVEWTNVGLPDQLRVLLAPQLDAFLHAGHRAVCHGGIALEEVIVPFVRISQEAVA